MDRIPLYGELDPKGKYYGKSVDEVERTILSDPTQVLEFRLPTKQTLLLALRRDWSLLFKIPEKYCSDDLILAAIRNDGRVLEKVIDPTDEMELAAVTNNFRMIRKVRIQTPGLIEAAKESYRNAQAILRRGEKLDMNVFEYLDEGYVSFTRSSTTKHNPFAGKTFNKVIDILEADGMKLSRLDRQTENMCLVAVRSNPEAFRYVIKQTVKICIAAVEGDPSNLRLVKKQSEKICRAAVMKDGMALQFVEDKFKTVEICRLAIANNEKAGVFGVPGFRVIVHHKKPKCLR